MFQMLLLADGQPAKAVTPSVVVIKDGTAAPGTGAIAEKDNFGAYEYLPSQAETDAAHVVFQMNETSSITQLINVYPITLADYKADVTGLSTFDHTTDEVITDTASRTASQADVTNLDVAVSTRMAEASINTTAGAVDVVTDVTNAVETDTASREASKADISNLPAKGQNLRYTNNASGTGTDDVTITDAT